MEEILAQIVANAAFRTLVEGVVVSVVGEIMHRRAVDPNFLANSDAAFSVLSQSKTPEAKTSAQNAIRDLMSSG